MTYSRILLIFLITCSLTVSVSAIDNDQDGIPDDTEQDIAEWCKPVLHYHDWDLQQGLASVEEWTELGSGVQLQTLGTNILGDWLNPFHTYNMQYVNGEPNFHQLTYHIANYNSDACTNGENTYVPDHFWRRLNFPESRKYLEAESRPIYYHVYLDDFYYPWPTTEYWVWIEYWYFLGYNDLTQHSQTMQQTYHEGDWEHVAIYGHFSVYPHGYQNFMPIYVDFFQHRGGYTRNDEQCWWSNYNGQMHYGYTPQYRHLNVWIAANSHASYNRYDPVYWMHASVMGATYENFTDNPDYSPQNNNIWNYDCLVDLGEVSFQYNVNCPAFGDHMDSHAFTVGSNTPDWLAWSGTFGSNYWELNLGLLAFQRTPPPESPAWHPYWLSNPIDFSHFGNTQFPNYSFGFQTAWMEYVPDPIWGDHPNYGPHPVVPRYNSETVQIVWWPVQGAMQHEVYRLSTSGDPENGLFDCVETLSGADTSFTDSTTVPKSGDSNTLYYYVVSIDSSNTTSEIVDYVIAKVPENPSGFIGSAPAPSYNPILRWNMNTEDNLMGFNVYKEIRVDTLVVSPFTKQNDDPIRDTTWTDGTFQVNHQGNEIASYYVTAVNWDHGESSPSDTLSGVGTSVADGSALSLIMSTAASDAYDLMISPIPFNNTTSISFNTVDVRCVSITLFNSLGQKVLDIYSSTSVLDGLHTVNLNLNSNILSNGIYFCQFKTNETAIIKKIILLK